MIVRVSLDLAYERVGVGDRQSRIDSNRHLSLQPMADIPGTDVRNILDFRGVLNGVQHARNHGFGGLPNDAEYRHRDNDADNGVCQWEAYPYPRGSHHDGE